MTSWYISGAAWRPANLHQPDRAGGELKMPGTRAPSPEVQPPKTLMGYLVYRIFNLLEKILPGADADWQATMRAIVLMAVFSCPVLTLFGFAALTITKKTDEAWKTGNALAVEYGVSAVKYSAGVIVCGVVVLLTALGIKKFRRRSRRSRSQEALPTEDAKQSDDPCPLNQKRHSSTAGAASPNDVGRVPRQPTG